MFQNRPLIQDDPADAGKFAQITLDSLGEAVISTNIAGRISYLNEVAESMLGWPREAALGRLLNDVFRIVNGCNRVALDPVALAMQQNRVVSLTANGVLIRRDGLESAIEESVAPIHDRNGHVTGAVMMLRAKHARNGV